jgi:hypothetical protein
MNVYLEDGTEITIDRAGRCPQCDADWSAGDIFDALRPQDWCKDKSDEELRKYVEESYSPPYKFSRLVGVELPYGHPGHYDGVSYYQCPDCEIKFPRFKHGAYRP